MVNYSILDYFVCLLGGLNVTFNKFSVINLSHCSWACISDKYQNLMNWSYKTEIKISRVNYKISRVNYKVSRVNYNISRVNYNISRVNYNISRVSYNILGFVYYRLNQYIFATFNNFSVINLSYCSWGGFSLLVYLASRYKIFFMLNSTLHEISTTHKN